MIVAKKIYYSIKILIYKTLLIYNRDLKIYVKYLENKNVIQNANINGLLIGAKI